MAEHGPCIGEASEWFTPPEIFDALRLTFDVDPCSPGPGHWVPARRDVGLVQPWRGLTFMNPPFGGRNGHVPWLRKFFGLDTPDAGNVLASDGIDQGTLAGKLVALLPMLTPALPVSLAGNHRRTCALAPDVPGGKSDVQHSQAILHTLRLML